MQAKLQEALHQFVSHLGAISSHSKQRKLSDVECCLDGVDRERDWVTFAQELYFTQGVGLLQFDRVAGYFSNICDTSDVEWIINKPFDNYEGKTMVHLETLNKKNALLKVLLNMGGSPNIPDHNYQTAVHCATQNRDSQSLKILLDHGGDLYQPDVSLKTPLDYIQGNLQCERVVTQHMMRMYKIDETDSKTLDVIRRLHESVIKGHNVKEINKLCNQLPPSMHNLVYLSLLFRVCLRGQKHMALFFLSKMIPPFDLVCAITNVTPLHYACMGNHFDIVLELVSRFPSLLFVKDVLPHRNWYPIHTACAYGASNGVVAVLLAGIAFMHVNNKDQDGGKFIDVAFLDSFGRSPLYIAAKCGNSSHISLMTHSLLNALYQCAPTLLSLTNGVSPSQVSAVHVAILQSNKKLLCQLLDSFSQAKCVLAYPSVMELKKILKTLSVNNNSQVTICKNEQGELILVPFEDFPSGNKSFYEMGMSPLALAAAVGDENMVECLLQAGALDDDGLAVQFAHFTLHQDIVVNILLQQQKLGSTEEDFVAEGMNLSSLPMSSFVLQHISQYSKIHLQNNKLTMLPIELFQLSVLKELNVSGNKLTELPNENGENIWNCPSLKIFDVNHNQLQELPGVLWKMPNLKYLFAHHNCIVKIVDNNTTDVHKLKVINVSYNKLTKIPTFFASIKKVYASNNMLDTLPESIWSSKTIVYLDVTSNLIANLCFPLVDISMKQRTESFTLQARKVSGSDSSVQPYPDDATRSKSLYTHIEAVSSLSVLKLGNNHLESFPREIICFATYLEELDLSYNRISSVDIRHFPPHIKSLNLKGCKMERFGFFSGEDDDIFDKECYLNRGPCFHRIHTRLTFLTGLNLAENFLVKLDFTEEDETLLYPNLQSLDLSANKLYGEFAPNIELLTKLQSLILSDNVHLTSLSMKLSHLSESLFVLKLNNLPNLRDPPMEYHYSSLKKMFSYMKSRCSRSEKNNSIKILVVGSSNKGRTTFVKRLMREKARGSFQSNLLFEVDEWTYSPSTNVSPVTFKIWDFSGKKSYYGNHHCFYSKRAIYLVVFSLQDGDSGVQEIDQWLMNINAYAPGAPVIIVGTHLDQVTTLRANGLVTLVKDLYTNKKEFPPIADVCCVHTTAMRTSYVNNVRRKIYDVASHLYLVNNKVVYKPDNDGTENTSDLLLQQLVPKSYLVLQKAIKKKVSELKANSKHPIQKKDEFLESFLSLMEDKEELNEAVQFLHSEKIILHFDDPILESLYILDPQWVCGNLYHAVQKANKESVNGILQIDLLHGCAGESISDDFLIALLSKLEIAVRVDKQLLLAPSLLPESIDYPPPVYVGLSKKAFLVDKDIYDTKGSPGDWLKSMSEDSTKMNTDDTNNDIVTVSANSNLPTEDDKPNDYLEITGLSLDSIVVEGAAPTGDTFASTTNVPISTSDYPQFTTIKSRASMSSLHRQFSEPLYQSIDDIEINVAYHPPLFRVWLAHFIPEGFWPRLLCRIASDLEIDATFTKLFPSTLKRRQVGESHSLNRTDIEGCFLWNLWKTGLVFVHEGVTLLELKQGISEPVKHKLVANSYLFNEKYRIEVIVHISSLAVVHNYDCQQSSPLPTKEIVKFGTKLLVLIEQHIIDIGEEWYCNTLSKTQDGNVSSYMVCSECLACKPQIPTHGYTTTYFMSLNGETLLCFAFKDVLKDFVESIPLNCPFHQEIPIPLLAPDLVFKDLSGVTCGSNIPLIIDKGVVLGRGGSALVLKGELCNSRQLVAVKIMHDGTIPNNDMEQFVRKHTITLKSYQMVRKEVAILAKLNHKNLTQLCGIFINPIMMLIELAPMGSLSSVLKEYKAANTLVVPSVLRASMYQIASAMDFLHTKRIAYLDLKTSNVLVWKFPLPNSLFQKHLGSPPVLLKITDYGISRSYSNTDKIIRYCSINGTSGYIAPEVLRNSLKFDLQPEKIDVFAYAMTLYELLTLYKPYELLFDISSSLSFNDAVSRKERPFITGKGTWTPYLMQRTMIQCWDHDPYKRPTMAKIKEWTKLPEFPSLRTVCRLPSGHLSAVSYCVVDRNHIHGADSVIKTALSPTAILSDQQEDLFCSALTTSSSRASTLLHKKANKTSQVWITQELESKDTSQLSIIMYKNNDLGYRSFYAKIKTNKVLAMVSVANYMWVTTVEQKLFVVHTPSMKTIATVSLRNANQSVTNLLHIVEWHAVLVMWSGMEIWYLQDGVDHGEIAVLDKQKLNSPLLHWCEVVFPDRVEVWGTQENGKVVILDWSLMGQHTNLLSLPTINSSQSAFEHITSSYNEENDGLDSSVQAWVSFKQDIRLTCWDATTRTPFYSVKMPTKTDDCQITCLLGCFDQICVGTSEGTVAILSAKDGRLLQKFSLHASQVRVLLELPQMIKPCICAELPMGKQPSLKERDKVRGRSSLPTSPVQDETITPVHKRGTSVKARNKMNIKLHSITSSLGKHPLFASVGDGLANWFGDGSETTQNLEFLTWTDDYA